MKLRSTILTACALTAGAAAPAQAIVGGTNADPGEYPSVAHVVIDRAFQCTGTLIAPEWVVTAAHCSSLVPGGIVNVPIGQPGQLIEVSIGAHKTPSASLTGYTTDGEKRSVAQVQVHPGYQTGQSGYDVSLLKLTQPSTKTPVQVAGAAEEAFWAPGTLATIAGFGVTEEDGDQPAVLQEAQVPIVTDAYAAKAYPGDFENVSQIGAGYERGGIDSCQGDSGGPLYVPNIAQPGTFRLAGDTSYGDGCARPGKPGIYGRLGDDTLREWIRSFAPEAIAGSTTTATTPTTTKTRGKKSSNQKLTADAR
jgi:secreted trypsin-like serine protease